jgi:hypothetical protein
MALLLRSHEACYEVVKNSFGCYLRQIPDPEANPALTREVISTFQVDPNFNKIPATVWAPWVQLCFHLAQMGESLEVAAAILQNTADPTQWRLTVPKQSVSGGSVSADIPIGSIDVATGEVIETWPPEGWLPVGTTHSHGTMGAFFSATDDRDEIRNPGLHMVLGSISNAKMTYDIASSITANGKRFKVDYNLIIDHSPVEGLSFHPDVLKNVSTEGRYTRHHGHYGRWTDLDDAWFDDRFGRYEDQQREREAPGSEWLPKKKPKKFKNSEVTADDMQLATITLEEIQSFLDNAEGLIDHSETLFAKIRLKENDKDVRKITRSLADIYWKFSGLFSSNHP